MEADLHNVIKKGSILKDVHKQYIMCQLFRAIRFLHSGNVLHRYEARCGRVAVSD